jgi:peptide/nickel transport system permease protein
MSPPVISSGADRQLPLEPSVPPVCSPRRRLRRGLSGSGLIGLAIVAFWVSMALVGPWIAPHGVGAIVADDSFAPMSVQFPLGSDYLGRDVLSRILHGGRYTVGLALAAALLASTVGTAFGLFAAVSGRWVDEISSRLLDALTCIPSKIFALVMVAAFGSSVPLLLLTAALSYLPGAFRIARALGVNLNLMEYVQVARARGEGRIHIACAEILPNMLHPMLADFGLRFVFVVLLLSGLSFLGLGVQPPAADLGSLVRENMSGLAEGAPAVIMPALAIATLTIGVNLVIDSLPGRTRRMAEGALR